MSDIDVIINDNIENISVIVDDSSPNYGQFYSLLSNLNILYSLSAKALETFSEMDTLQESLTAKWTETATEMDTLQESLTSKWVETATEVDTMQESLTAGWQEAYESNILGIIDGGFF
jgi:hypothetical protein